MRRLFAALAGATALLATVALAASPEDDYFAARNKAIAKVKQLEAADSSNEKADAFGAKALADLQKRLKVLIGPVTVKGFPSEGKINLQTLGSEVGSGMLDGLMFTASETGEAPSLVVTTDGLLQKWLKGQAAEKDASLKYPTPTPEVLMSDAFYTSGIGSDAAYTRAAVLDIAKPAGADFAYAALGRWAQDIGPGPLDHIVVAVVKGQRVLVVDQKAKAKFPEIPACKALWDAATAKGDKLYKAYQASGLKNEKVFAEYEKASAAGDKDWFACVGAHAKAEKVYPDLVAEAQDVANRLAGN